LRGYREVRVVVVVDGGWKLLRGRRELRSVVVGNILENLI
jgi:hypothetical protein